MLRKSIVAVTLSLLTVSGLHAEDENKPGALMKWLQGPTIGRPAVKRTKPADSGIRHAVISDAAKQAPEIRQTSSQPQQSNLKPAVAAPKPTPTAQPSQRTMLAPMSDVRTAASAPARTVSRQVATAPVPDPNVNSVSMGHPPNGPIAHQQPVHYGPHMQGGWAGPGSLYPAPRPGIPHQLGATVIPHQAFHPHEMLHAHRYKSMYGPYYYKVKGHWIVTPYGVLSQENWQLKGTTVDVKYKSHISPFALFSRPVIR
ncbi:MAG: hypothetical protein ABJZ55_23390 [Fuerstiella sp.]